MNKRFNLLTLVFAASQILVVSPALAQLPNLGGIGGSLMSGSADKPAAGGGGGGASSAPVTHKHGSQKFHFTIPAGWAKTNGDLGGDSILFRKGNTSAHFQYHFTGMAGNFPAESSVAASLNSAKQDIKLGKNVSAKRRDDKCESNPKNLCARGWELIDSGNAGPQRIIWQVYDKNNTYFNFMASAEKAEFPAVQAELQAIIDSIKFE